MPNEMLPLKFERMPENEVGTTLDAELERLAITLRSQIPSPAIEKRLQDAAAASGLLRQENSPSRLWEPACDRKPLASWAQFLRPPRWGWVGAAVCVCLLTLAGTWAIDRQELAPDVPTPQPGMALVQVPQIQRSVSSGTGDVSGHTSDSPHAQIAILSPAVRQPSISNRALVEKPDQTGGYPIDNTAVSSRWDTQDLLGVGARTHVAGLPVIAPMPMTSHEPLQTLRVRVAAEDLWRMGFYPTPPASNQPMLADFLVGEDGRPLGVRLVGIEQ